MCVLHLMYVSLIVLFADSSLNQSERSYLIGGVCALLLGAVFLSLGLMQYRRKSCDTNSNTLL